LTGASTKTAFGRFFLRLVETQLVQSIATASPGHQCVINGSATLTIVVNAPGTTDIAVNWGARLLRAAVLSLNSLMLTTQPECSPVVSCGDVDQPYDQSDDRNRRNEDHKE
jgi:hypothetical protein